MSDPAFSGIIPYKQRPPAPNDPMSSMWPATLPLELALGDSTPQEICEAYGLEREDFDRLGSNPAFRAELKGAIEALRKEGASFRVRAQMQAVELLKTSFEMTQDKSIPPNVRAKLIEMTINAAGLNASASAASVKAGGLNAQMFSITLNLGGTF